MPKMTTTLQAQDVLLRAMNIFQLHVKVKQYVAFEVCLLKALIEEDYCTTEEAAAFIMLGEE